MNEDPKKEPVENIERAEWTTPRLVDVDANADSVEAGFGTLNEGGGTAATYSVS